MLSKSRIRKSAVGSHIGIRGERVQQQMVRPQTHGTETIHLRCAPFKSLAYIPGESETETATVLDAKFGVVGHKRQGTGTLSLCSASRAISYLPPEASSFSLFSKPSPLALRTHRKQSPLQHTAST